MYMYMYLYDSFVMFLSCVGGSKNFSNVGDPRDEASHVTSQEQFNLKHISDAPKDKPDPQVLVDRERQKALKKRCRKLRQRMSQRYDVCMYVGDVSVRHRTHTDIRLISVSTHFVVQFLCILILVH